jgi:hypothetical protein
MESRAGPAGENDSFHKTIYNAAKVISN